MRAEDYEYGIEWSLFLRRGEYAAALMALIDTGDHVNVTLFAFMHVKGTSRLGGRGREETAAKSNKS